MYNSTIFFTLDTICPWTYISLRRLHTALTTFYASRPSAPVAFTITFLPYQLYPDLPKEGQNKIQWYKTSRYGDSDEKMNMYTTIMGSYGRAAGIDFQFGGEVANTMDTHRVLGYFQEERGAETAEKIVASLYSQYFERERHPSSLETLLQATSDAGIDEAEARRVIENSSVYLVETKRLIQEQASNGIDAVPHIVFEGKKRDITLQGAKEVDEYVKALEQICKEST